MPENIGYLNWLRTHWTNATSKVPLKKFISNYKQKILAQYFISQGATCFQKCKRGNDKAVNSL